MWKVRVGLKWFGSTVQNRGVFGVLWEKRCERGLGSVVLW